MNAFSRWMTRSASAAAGAVLLVASAQAADISGAGATFPYPIYAKWAEAYKAKTGIGMNYQSIGSGGGIKQIKAKTVDFGASDMPLKPEELKEAGLDPVSDRHRRRRAGRQREGHRAGRAQARRRAARRHLSRQDHEMERPGHRRPQPGRQPAEPGDRRRAPLGRLRHDLRVRRLSREGESRLEGQGRRRTPRWSGRPASAARATRASPRSCSRTDGAIGYVEYAYAKQNKLAYARCRTAPASSWRPTLKSFQAAAANADWAERARLQPDPHRPARRRELADHRRHLHPGATQQAQKPETPSRCSTSSTGPIAKRRQDGRGAATMCRCRTSVVG